MGELFLPHTVPGVPRVLEIPYNVFIIADLASACLNTTNRGCIIINTNNHGVVWLKYDKRIYGQTLWLILVVKFKMKVPETNLKLGMCKRFLFSLPLKMVTAEIVSCTNRRIRPRVIVRRFQNACLFNDNVSWIERVTLKLASEIRSIVDYTCVSVDSTLRLHL